MKTSRCERCAIARKNRGLNQDVAAPLLNMTVRNLQRYESENYDKISTYEKMSSLYGCSLSWLLTGEGPMDANDSYLSVYDMYSVLPDVMQKMVISYVKQLKEIHDNQEGDRKERENVFK